MRKHKCRGLQVVSVWVATTIFRFFKNHQRHQWPYCKVRRLQIRFRPIRHPVPAREYPELLQTPNLMEQEHPFPHPSVPNIKVSRIYKTLPAIPAWRIRYSDMPEKDLCQYFRLCLSPSTNQSPSGYADNLPTVASFSCATIYCDQNRSTYVTLIMSMTHCRKFI